MDPPCRRSKGWKPPSNYPARVRFPPITDTARAWDRETVKARLSDWMTFVLTFVGSIVTLIGVAFVLNFTGDCTPEVTDCGVRYGSRMWS